MKVLIIGYGKMGQAIEKVALERHHEIAGKFDVGDAGALPRADVAIEFTQPGAAIDNLKRCFDQQLPVVCGTTGWLHKKNEVEEYCRKANGALFYSSNYSLGVNLFFRLSEFLAGMMDRYPEYGVQIDETHHTEKKDAPSGTAISLAEGILRHSPARKQWHAGEKTEPGSVAIRSFRIDPAPGTHRVVYSSPIDDLEIIHTAHSREGFAQGAVRVAEWLRGKTGIFSMDDFLKF